MENIIYFYDSDNVIIFEIEFIEIDVTSNSNSFNFIDDNNYIRLKTKDVFYKDIVNMTNGFYKPWFNLLYTRNNNFYFFNRCYIRNIELLTDNNYFEFEISFNYFILNDIPFEFHRKSRRKYNINKIISLM